MKVSKYIIEFFESKGIKTFFVFQGGAIMNLIHEIGESRKSNYIIPHHEQSYQCKLILLLKWLWCWNGYKWTWCNEYINWSLFSLL